jgi:hypothetical protein
MPGLPRTQKFARRAEDGRYPVRVAKPTARDSVHMRVFGASGCSIPYAVAIFLLIELVEVEVSHGRQ